MKMDAILRVGKGLVCISLLGIGSNDGMQISEGWWSNENLKAYPFLSQEKKLKQRPNDEL